MTERENTQLPAVSATEKTGSEPTRVTLYEDRAEVVRRATVSLAEGTQWVRIAGVTPYVDARSLRARIVDDDTHVEVTSARVQRRVLRVHEYAEREISDLEREVDERGRVLVGAEQELERAAAQRKRVSALMSQWLKGLRQVPRELAGEREKSWSDAYANLDEQAQEAVRAWSRAREAREDAQRALERAEAALEVRRAEAPLCEASVEVQVTADIAGEAAIEIVYRTPSAMWRPEHAAHLEHADDGSGTVEITTFATVWQRTGERWDDVSLVFSTARPSRAASPPDIEEDVITSRRKSEEERRHVVIESRDQAVVATGVGGARRVDEMPGVDDGGEPLEFTSGERMTLPSDGEPYRVEISRIELPAKVGRVLRPEVSPVAHVRADVTLESATPLLAGPVRIARGSTTMGRSRLDFVPAWESFELGFGPDDGVRVRRKQHRKRDESALTGTQTITFTTDLFLSNLSQSPKTVEVRERLPVAEVEGVKVTLREAHGFVEDSQDGFLDAMIELDARGHEHLTVEYEVKASAKMVLPF